MSWGSLRFSGCRQHLPEQLARRSGSAQEDRDTLGAGNLGNLGKGGGGA